VIQNNPFAPPEAENVASEEGYLWWCWERMAIFYARENYHPAPWSDHWMFQQYRFCNLHRKNDRVSKWIIDNLLLPYEDCEDLFFIAAIARYVNLPTTLQALLDAKAIPMRVEDFDYELFSEVVDGITRAGGKAWTGSYMIFPSKKETGLPKGKAVGKHILAPLKTNVDNLRHAVHETKTVEAVVTELMKNYGFSSFTSGQVASDLSYTKQLGSASDLRTFAPIGPGSSACLDALYGKRTWKQKEFNEKLIHLLDRIENELKIDDLTLHDAQNAACETFKMIKTIRGEGRPRNTFTPTVKK